jgi:hypothetical protein
MEHKTFEKIQTDYPNEWVLIGNPIISKTKVTAGIPILHGKDKREIAYLGRELIKQFDTYALRYTGALAKNRKFWL